MAYTDIDKPSDYFNTVLWTGDGTTKDITGVGFQPDLVWAKKRSAAGYHAWCDVVRGGTKTIFSNASIAEETSAVDWILSFASDGFGVNSAGNLNQSSATYVAWNWLASNTTASNTDGSITSTVSANTTSGFSIVSYTGNGSAGATIGHSLGVAPSMFIIKNRSSGTTDWAVYNKNLGSGNKLLLNSSASSSASSYFNSTSPTSTVFSVNDSDTSNGSGNSMIAYCFAEKKGFSKFGSYVANADNNGPMIYLGFKPAFVIIKRTSNSNPWILLDNKRGSYNVNQSKLYPNNTDAENTDTSNGIDFLSNGFKIRRNNTEINGASGDTFIYIAFAENPFVTSTGIPACAR